MAKSKMTDDLTATWSKIPAPIKTGIYIFGAWQAWNFYNDWKTKREAKKRADQMQALYMQYYGQQPSAGQIITSGAGYGLPGGTPGQVTPTAGKLSYSPDTYVNWADAIDENLQTGFGEDWEAVLNIFKKMNTAADVNALNLAFGERTNYKMGIPFYTANLAKWLTEEMADYIPKINQALALKQIPVQF
jgi:hypothetical protein